MRESGDLIRQSQRILFNAIRIALKNKDTNVQSVNGAIVYAQSAQDSSPSYEEQQEQYHSLRHQ